MPSFVSGGAARKSSGSAIRRRQKPSNSESLPPSASISKDGTSIRTVKPVVVDAPTEKRTDPGTDDSSDSEVSLLPSLSNDDDYGSTDESSDCSDDRGLARLERKLDLRMARLRRICAGRRPSYVRLLEFHEEAVREMTIAEYKQSQRDKQNGSLPSKVSHADQKKAKDNAIEELTEEKGHSDAIGKPPFRFRLWWWLLFEIHHTIPVSLKLLVICMGHLTFHNFLGILLRTVYQNFFSGLMTFSTFVCLHIIVGLALMRGNGYLFTLLGESSYKIVKFDMHNRLKLGHMDARLLKVLKGSIMGSAANMFGFYLIFNGLVYFYNDRVHPAFYKPLDDLYTSIRDDAAKQVSGMTDLKFYYRIDYSQPGELPDITGVEQETCTILNDYVPPRFRWWFNYCCRDPFQEFRIHDLTFHGVWFFLTAGVSALASINVLKLCDE